MQLGFKMETTYSSSFWQTLGPSTAKAVEIKTLTTKRKTPDDDILVELDKQRRTQSSEC